MLTGAIVLTLFAALLVWALCGIQEYVAEAIQVEVAMADKQVGEIFTATITAVPAGAPLTDYVFTFSDESLFQRGDEVGGRLLFTGKVPSSGQTLTASAKNVNGETLTATVALASVVATAPVVATAITLEVV